MNKSDLKRIISECIIEEMPKALNEAKVIREHFAKEMHPFVQASLRTISEGNKREALKCIKECGGVANISRNMAKRFSVNEIKQINKLASNKDMYDLSKIAIYESFFNAKKNINESFSKSLLREEIEESFWGAIGKGIKAGAKKLNPLNWFKKLGGRITNREGIGAARAGIKDASRAFEKLEQKAASTRTLISTLKKDVEKAIKAQYRIDEKTGEYFRRAKTTLDKNGNKVILKQEEKITKEIFEKEIARLEPSKQLRAAEKELAKMEEKIAAKSELRAAEHGVTNAVKKGMKRTALATGIGAGAVAGGLGFAAGRHSGKGNEEGTISEPAKGGRGDEDGRPIVSGPTTPVDGDRGGDRGGRKPEAPVVTKPEEGGKEETKPVVTKPSPEDKKPEEPEAKKYRLTNREKNQMRRMEQGKGISAVGQRYSDRQARKQGRESIVNMTDANGNKLDGRYTLAQQKRNGIKSTKNTNQEYLAETIEKNIREELAKRNRK